MKYAKKRGIPLDVPWRDLTDGAAALGARRRADWVSWKQVLAGQVVRRARASSSGWRRKAYKMHIRVLLSNYRAYTPCAACDGARLKPDALLWRLGTKEDADAVLAAGAALPRRTASRSATTQLARAARA